MSTDAFMAAAGPVVADFKRNGRGQPVIIPADGGKPVPYNRPSSWGKKLEDMYGINQWEKRCIAAGLARTPSLVARCLAIPMDPRDWSKADKDALNAIADEAKTAARANQAADIGTALHRMTERSDLGEDLGELPEPFAADIAAYRAGMTAHGIATDPKYIECRLVCDELKLAGTADRIVSRRQRLIYDLKTGESIELAALGYAVQEAIYAHSSLYDIATGAREAIDVDLAVGLIGHLPAGKGEFHLHEVDIAAGWEAALLCADIDRWRKRKGLLVAVPAPKIAQPAGDNPETTGDEPQAAPLSPETGQNGDHDGRRDGGASNRSVEQRRPSALASRSDEAAASPGVAGAGSGARGSSSTEVTQPTGPEMWAAYAGQTVAAERRKATVDNLRERCRTVAAMSPKGGEWLKAQMAAQGLNLYSPDTDLTAVVDLVKQAEAMVSAPFNDEPPAADTAATEAPAPTPTRIARKVKEGADLDDTDAAVVRMKAAYADLDAASRSWLEGIVKESITAGRSLHMGGGHTTRRRVRIITGLATLALAEQAPSGAKEVAA